MLTLACNRLRRCSCHIRGLSCTGTYDIRAMLKLLMPGATNPPTFEDLVEWAYSTLPQKVKDLPDFPGIQILDEPPPDILKKNNLPPGHEMLGCYTGLFRTQRRHNIVQMAPDLIFVFRGPILRHSKGDLPAEVKRVVWHEVAHWLGHDEDQMKDLGL